MLIKTGNYVILRSLGSKPVLVKVTAVSGDGKKYKAMPEIRASEDDPSIEFKLNDVAANLGSSPHPGSVYGVKVEPLRETFEHPFFGTISVHHELNDNTRKTLKSSIHATAQKFKAQKIQRLPLEVELRTQTGKMAGFYKHRPKAEFDLLCVKLDDDLSDLEYRFAHEFAHGLWFRCFTPKMRLAWVDMFHSAVAVNSYSDKDLQALLDDILSNGDLRSFMKENPDEQPVLRAIFRHIKQTHAIERSHFELAMMLEQDVRKYWPSSVDLGEKSVLLTDYAKKSPEELWAEAWSLKFIGKKLPSKVSALLDKCVSRLVPA